MKSAFEASRLNAFSFDPDELVLITDKKHPLYDARVELPLKPEFVESIRTHGIGQAVLIRKDPDTGKAFVVDGRQRVKAAREINKDRTNGDRIMVPCTVRRGDEADAYTMTTVLNVHRQDDEKRELMAKAQRLAQLGRSEGDIAVALGVSVATAKRYLDTEVRKTEPRKTRGASKRPKTEKVKAVRDALGDSQAGKMIKRWLNWTLGEGPEPADVI